MQNPLSSSAYLLFTLLLFSQAFSAICQTHGSFRINNLRMMMPGRSLDSDSSDRIPNFTSDYIDLMIASDYYGRWASTNNLKGMDVIPPGFDNPNGLAVLNPYEAGADLVLLDSENIDGNFYFIFFNYNDLFQDISSHNGLMKVVNISATYWKGDDLLRQGKISAETCVVDELTVTVLNAETNKPFNPIEDKESDAVIQVIAVSKECPLNFETTLMTPYDERFKSQRWIYSLIYLVWCIPNIIVGLRKFRDLEDIDKTQGAQFFLIFNINFYLSMWNNAFAQEFAGTVGLILVALLNLFIWSSNFGTSFRCIQGRRNPCFLAGSIFFTIIMRIVYTYSHGVLLATFIAIVLIDIIRHFRMQGRLNYDVSLYLGMLLPSLVTVAYLTLYDQNFARISAHPELTQFFIIFLFLAFGVLPIQIEIKRFIRKMQREKRLINIKNINPEDVCPICLQTLVPPEPKSDSEDLVDVIVEPKDDENPQLNPAPVENKSHQKQSPSRVLKTECGHMFHESCLTQWIRIQPECPSCRKPIVDFI